MARNIRCHFYFQFEAFSTRLSKLEKQAKALLVFIFMGWQLQMEHKQIRKKNPFADFFIDKTFNYIVECKDPIDAQEVNLAKVIKAYDTPFSLSKNVYSYIPEHMAEWIEEAIEIRNGYPK